MWIKVVLAGSPGSGKKDLIQLIRDKTKPEDHVKDLLRVTEADADLFLFSFSPSSLKRLKGFNVVFQICTLRETDRFAWEQWEKLIGGADAFILVFNPLERRMLENEAWNTRFLHAIRDRGLEQKPLLYLYNYRGNDEFVDREEAAKRLNEKDKPEMAIHDNNRTDVFYALKVVIKEALQELRDNITNP